MSACAQQEAHTAGTPCQAVGLIVINTRGLLCIGVDVHILTWWSSAAADGCNRDLLLWHVSVQQPAVVQPMQVCNQPDDVQLTAASSAAVTPIQGVANHQSQNWLLHVACLEGAHLSRTNSTNTT